MSDPAIRLNTALEGRYRIERQVGEGGMATVYLADDRRHERKVALKVLKPELAAVVGAERFPSEIKTTANLQHPHILPLFDSGEADGFLFYAMPYVEGESLRERLDREHQLPVDEAVQIAKNVAEALDYAHRHGVIHRDIKPANILLQDGKPVVSDFGIALAVTAGGPNRLTETGLSLGTPHYMSPEQATGDLGVGAATDIYALGCVLYEMLVGEPPYTGSTPQAILGKIIRAEPVSAAETRRTVPPNVDAAIRKALENVPADRFTGADAFARALGDVGFRHGGVVAERGGTGSRSWNRLAIAGWSMAGILGLVASWALLQRQPPRTVARFLMPLGSEQDVAGVAGVRLALSPDGSRIIYVGPGADGGTQLWQRRLDDLQPNAIPGTEGARSPAVSPDGLSVTFSSAGIRTVSLLGGQPLTVATEGVSPAWGSDGMIYFIAEDVVHRVPATGGTPEAFASGTIADQRYPDPLPRGRGVVVSLTSGPASESRIAVVGADGGEPRQVVEGVMARYAPSGHLLYVTAEGTLRAAPFDLDRLEIVGPPVGLVEGVDFNFATSAVQFAISGSGALVYRTGGSPLTGVAQDLVWVSRSGVVQPVDSQFTGSFRAPALSPDGSQVALGAAGTSAATFSVVVRRLDRGGVLRLTPESVLADRPTWTPDGRSITYRSGGDLWTRRADGSADAVPQLDEERPIAEGVWSPDGEWLVYRTDSQVSGNGDILAMPTGQDADPVPLATSEAYEATPALSPDGGCLAYSSNESGRREVYVVPFPSVDRRSLASTSGGSQPVWSRLGTELFYRSGQGEMVAVDVDTDCTPGASAVLFSTSGYASNPGGRPQYDVAPGDARFLMIREFDEEPQPSQLILVQNFFEELRRLAPN